VSDERHTPALPPDYFRRPSPARLWNYLQGGKDHYEIDRAAGDAMARIHPGIFDSARQTRQFHNRAVRYVAEQGIRQYLDLGCGLPAPQCTDNTHDIAHRHHGDARVVYNDNDKVVLAHAHALLTSRIPESGPIAYIDADIHDIEAILEQAAGTLDFSQPIAVIACGVLGYVPELADVHRISRAIVDAIPTGSYLIAEDGVNTHEDNTEAAEELFELKSDRYTPRSPDVIHEYFDGLDLITPGVVSIPLWQPGLIEVGQLRAVTEYGGVGRKP
jgi:S-adenosyl methyltransferase